ncbi:MAG: PrgI family protein [Lachnospiraceae bacterium]|nr:PrgI family protein [Lachnospiraceae bacterium]
MAISVDVAKDPKAIKNRFIGNFTKRQVICFSSAAIVGIPFYLLTRKMIGTDVAAMLMVAIMLPFFFVAMYEKDGEPAEKYIMQIIKMRFIRPGIRKYKVENLYEQLKERERMEKEVEILEKKRKASRSRSKGRNDSI